MNEMFKGQYGLKDEFKARASTKFIGFGIENKIDFSILEKGFRIEGLI